MTDKQIIIDGVNVIGCEFCDWKGSNVPQCRVRFASFKPICEGYDCYYKQLKRKEQYLETICKTFDIEYIQDKETNQIIAKCNKLLAKEQECEALQMSENEAGEIIAELQAYKDVNEDFKTAWEELKTENEELKKIINEAKNSNLDLKSFLVGEAVQNEYEQQLDQLKAKNEELKKNLNEGCLQHLTLMTEQRVLLKTLAEIKEIVEVEIECKTYEIENDCFNETRCKALNEHIDFTKQIIQKISEVEND